jgi:hypothetical protein
MFGDPFRQKHKWYSRPPPHHPLPRHYTPLGYSPYRRLTSPNLPPLNVSAHSRRHANLTTRSETTKVVAVFVYMRSVFVMEERSELLGELFICAAVVEDNLPFTPH